MLKNWVFKNVKNAGVIEPLYLPETRFHGFLVAAWEMQAEDAGYPILMKGVGYLAEKKNVVDHESLLWMYANTSLHHFSAENDETRFTAYYTTIKLAQYLTNPKFDKFKSINLDQTIEDLDPESSEMYQSLKWCARHGVACFSHKAMKFLPIIHFGFGVGLNVFSLHELLKPYMAASFVPYTTWTAPFGLAVAAAAPRVARAIGRNLRGVFRNSNQKNLRKRRTSFKRGSRKASKKKIASRPIQSSRRNTSVRSKKRPITKTQRKSKKARSTIEKTRTKRSRKLTTR